MLDQPDATERGGRSLPAGPRHGRPRTLRAQLLVGGLCAVLGFALALQVRSSGDDVLRTAREEDLVRLLDDVTARADRLRAEVADLERTRDRLASGDGAERAALAEARRRAETLGILAGTLPASGPGIELVVSDPDRTVTPAILLGAVQELRDAGAEALQIDRARVVASTAFTERGGRLLVDGTALRSPYRVVAIGDPTTLTSALDIPGGVLESLRRVGASGAVTAKPSVAVDAVLPAPRTPQYARPAPPP